MTDFREILSQELIHAMGCTEPIAIALCAAKARELLGCRPERMTVSCSGNVIKNAMGVTVPNACGAAGIDTAAAVGCFGGDAGRGLEVLVPVTAEQAQRARAFIRAGHVRLEHKRGVDNLYIQVVMNAGDDEAEAVIAGAHNRFIRLRKNNGLILDIQDDPKGSAGIPDFEFSDILHYARQLDLACDSGLYELLDAQIRCNLAIAEEGLAGEYGASVGKTLMESYPDDRKTRLRAYAAAGSDARMAGSPMPVVINSGSGNQGMTTSLPLIIYAREQGLSRDALHRALILANLTAVYIKRLIGKMSAFCGVVSAAAAAGAGLAFLQDLDEKKMGDVIAVTLLTSGGILCDGAKASCASKISIAVDNALLALEMVKRGRTLPQTQGLSGRDVDETIRKVARVAREGMKETDEVILDEMLRREV